MAGLATWQSILMYLQTAYRQGKLTPNNILFESSCRPGGAPSGRVSLQARWVETFPVSTSFFSRLHEVCFARKSGVQGSLSSEDLKSGK